VAEDGGRFGIEGEEDGVGGFAFGEAGGGEEVVAVANRAAFHAAEERAGEHPVVGGGGAGLGESGVEIGGDGADLGFGAFELIEEDGRGGGDGVVGDEDELGGLGLGGEHFEEGALLAHDYAGDVADAEAEEGDGSLAFFIPPAAAASIPAGEEAGVDVDEGSHPAAGEHEEAQLLGVAGEVGRHAVDVEMAEDGVGVPQVDAEDAEVAAGRGVGIEVEATADSRGADDLEFAFLAEGGGGVGTSADRFEGEVEEGDGLVGAADLARLAEPADAGAMDVIALDF